MTFDQWWQKNKPTFIRLANYNLHLALHEAAERAWHESDKGDYFKHPVNFRYDEDSE